MVERWWIRVKRPSYNTSLASPQMCETGPPHRTLLKDLSYLSETNYLSKYL